MSPATKALLYWNTVRNLKPIQIYRRFWFRYHRPSLNLALPSITLAKQKGVWQTSVTHPQTMLESDTFRFLNRVEQLTSVDSWNSPNLPKLWLYNLHYFDDLNAQGAPARTEWHCNLIKRWITENPPTHGNGWEPYPSSLRIVNWVKWALAGNRLGESELQSLYLQARYLSNRVEWHLLGNHLLANAKALLFVGTFFSGEEAKEWLELGLRIYEEQISVQIMSDGVHFERSPMYHAIILEDFLDILNLSQAYSGDFKASFRGMTQTTAENMLAAYQKLIHPDGQISFFNDAAFGISATFFQLSEYAAALGIYCAPKTIGIQIKQSNDLVLMHLGDAGYIRIENNNACALLDVGPIGPDYLPGHAHADTLSFELSVFGQRLIVNGGTSTYAGDLRMYERSTQAHSTVVVGQKDSSEVWGEFRVARKAYPNALKIGETDHGFEVVCSHDGYQRLSSGLTHTRAWKISDGDLLVSDTVGFDENKDSKLEPPKSVARYILHSSIVIKSVDANQWQLLLPNMKVIQLKVHAGRAHIDEGSYASEFGKTQKTPCLVVELTGSSYLSAQVQLKWN